MSFSSPSSHITCAGPPCVPGAGLWERQVLVQWHEAPANGVDTSRNPPAP